MSVSTYVFFLRNMKKNTLSGAMTIDNSNAWITYILYEIKMVLKITVMGSHIFHVSI